MKTRHTLVTGLLMLPGWAIAQNCDQPKKLLYMASSIKNTCPVTYALVELSVNYCEGRIGISEYGKQFNSLTSQAVAESQPGTACYQAKVKAGLIGGGGQASLNSGSTPSLGSGSPTSNAAANELANQRLQAAGDQVSQNMNDLISTDLNMNTAGSDAALTDAQHTNVDLAGRLPTPNSINSAGTNKPKVAANWNTDGPGSNLNDDTHRPANKPGVNETTDTPGADPKIGYTRRTVSPGVELETFPERPKPGTMVAPEPAPTQYSHRYYGPGVEHETFPQRPKPGAAAAPQATPTPAAPVPATAKATPLTWNYQADLFAKPNPGLPCTTCYTPPPTRSPSGGGGFDLDDMIENQPRQQSTWGAIKAEVNNWLGRDQPNSGSSNDSEYKGGAYSMVSRADDRTNNIINSGLGDIFNDTNLITEAEEKRHDDEGLKDAWTVFRRQRREPRKGFDEDDAKKAKEDHLDIFDDK